MKIQHILLLAICLFISCNSTDDTKQEDPSINDDSDYTDVADSPYVISVGKTFEWRLDDLPDTYSTTADVIDIDAFSASAALVAKLKSEGKTVIAYLSVGSVESYRADADQFPTEVVGAVYEGYEDENWLDIRNIAAIAPILQARLDMIKAKGFDGIEPDNINGYQNNSGFDLTAKNSIPFCRWLINEAHTRGLSIGQKNGEELVPDMVDEFDWMLTEGAVANDWHMQVVPYIAAGKAVFLTEYTDTMTSNQFQNNVCPIATAQKFSAILKNRDLTDATFYCN